VWVFVLFSLIVSSVPVMAVSGYLTGTNATNPGFNRFYSAPATPTPAGQRNPPAPSLSGTNASCNICHVAGSGTDLNAYGNAWAIAHNSGITTAEAFAAIEDANSDNDPKGTTNIREIAATAQPGWTPGPTNTFYDVLNPGSVVTTGNNPPAITGNLDPAAKIAVFRPSTSTFYLDENGSRAWNGCTTDKCAAFGVAGDVPLLGDWNGIGTVRAGVFRPSNGTFYLDANGNSAWDGCATDKCIAIGEANDVPLVGDWNGNGVTKVGVFRPSNGTFYLDYNGNGLWDGCAVDKCFAIGSASDTPLVGDWNGTGFTKVGFFRPAAATFYLDYDGNGVLDGCVLDKCIAFGFSTDTPLVGDWNGNGRTKVGVFRPSTVMFYLDYDGNGAWSGCATDKCEAFGFSTDTPVVGDWSGSGTTKVGVFRPSTAAFYLDYDGNGAWDGCTTDRCVGFGITGDVPLVGKR
jgi:hypothetical protein